MTVEKKLEALEERAKKNLAGRAWIEIGCCSDEGLHCHLTAVYVGAWHRRYCDYLHHGEWISRATALDRIAGVYY